MCDIEAITDLPRNSSAGWESKPNKSLPKTTNTNATISETNSQIENAGKPNRTGNASNRTGNGVHRRSLKACSFGAHFDFRKAVIVPNPNPNAKNRVRNNTTVKPIDSGRACRATCM